MQDPLLYELKDTRMIGQPPEKDFCTTEWDRMELWPTVWIGSGKFFAPRFADIIGAGHEEDMVGLKLHGFIAEAEELLLGTPCWRGGAKDFDLFASGSEIGEFFFEQ